MGNAPGIWLPECAYDHGLEDIISELGLQYFITATHGVLYASPRPKYGVYSPILTKSGVAVFGRDPRPPNRSGARKKVIPGITITANSTAISPMIYPSTISAPTCIHLVCVAIPDKILPYHC